MAQAKLHSGGAFHASSHQMPSQSLLARWRWSPWKPESLSGTEGVAQGSSPCSTKRSANAHNNLWLLLSCPDCAKTFPEALKDARRPSLDQFLGIPKLTSLLLSDWIIFQCLSRSASASWSSVPSAVNGVSRLGAGAALLGEMDLEWPSNMSVTIFNSLRSWRSSWPPMFCKALIIPPAWEASSWQSEKCFPETRSNRISSSTPVALSKLSLTKAMGPVGTDTTHSSSKSSSCKNPTSPAAYFHLHEGTSPSTAPGTANLQELVLLSKVRARGALQSTSRNIRIPVHMPKAKWQET